MDTVLETRGTLSGLEGRTKESYTFHADPGHGWLKVDRAELERLGLINEISGYSYQSGDFVYLEEDSDASKFLNKKQELGEIFILKEISSNNDSFVRRLPHYRP